MGGAPPPQCAFIHMDARVTYESSQGPVPLGPLELQGSAPSLDVEPHLLVITLSRRVIANLEGVEVH